MAHIYMYYPQELLRQGIQGELPQIDHRQKFAAFLLVLVD